MRTEISKAEIDKYVMKARETGKPIYLWDQTVKGFGARCSPTGTVTFCFEYTFGGRGHVKRMSLGNMLDITPDQAREKAAELRKRMLAGENVAQTRMDTRGSPLFADLIEPWLASTDKTNEMKEQVRRAIAKDVTSEWGSRAIAMITDANAARLIDKIKQRAPAMARLVHGQLRQLFAWARLGGYIKINPLRELPAPPPGKPRERFLSLDELRAAWLATEEMGYPHGCYFQLMMLTGLRRAEVAEARWEEFDFKTNIWNIPGCVRDKDGQKIRGTKGHKAHSVPLSREALDVLSRCPKQGNGEFVSP